MNLKDNSRQEMIEEMKKVYCRDDKHEQMNTAIIDCEIHLIDFSKLINFNRFSCFSYSESSNGLTGLISDRKFKFMFHFTANKNYIMIYPVKNKDYVSESFVDYYEHIKKTIDNNARLFLYEEYQRVKKQEEQDYQKYKAEKEKEEYESRSH